MVTASRPSVNVGTASAPNAAVTVHAAVIGPVVYGLELPGVPPQPDTEAMKLPGAGVIVQVVVLPEVTGLAQVMVPPGVLATPVTVIELSAKVAVTVQAAVTGPVMYGLTAVVVPPQPLIDEIT